MSDLLCIFLYKKTEKIFMKLLYIYKIILLKVSAVLEIDVLKIDKMHSFSLLIIIDQTV